MNSLASRGYITIVNEAIDLEDGGVSGVALGDTLEFVPEDTPRGVESEGSAGLPLDIGLALLETVYGSRPKLPPSGSSRVEFSLHPSRVGYRKEHSIVWEAEDVDDLRAKYAQPSFTWPNRFSRFIGDKAFGLLVADAIGLPVPRTTVIGRHVAPFSFGRATGTGEVWTRPCPDEQKPGEYPTFARWVDPSQLFELDGQSGKAIVSILAQEGVSAKFSGATLPGHKSRENLIEGVYGQGEAFMLGVEAPVKLPPSVKSDLDNLLGEAESQVGRPVRIEWVHDGHQAWVVQFHATTHKSHGATIVPGFPANGWLQFLPAAGLDELRHLLDQAAKAGRGIEVVGRIGVTSHVGDLLRKSDVPARFSHSGDERD
ncbi:hypothetical protein AB0283_05690 [Micromonospora vinacea]|uniref:hypothetical protein n=1 Tax=Micromonospora vinacea TaxID=709878 RepID=UPI00344F1D9B